MSNLPGIERRNAVRRRALMSGSLRIKTGNSVHSCVVRNLSVTGARLSIQGGHWLPDRFVLDIPHQDIRVGARIMWRAEGAIGVAFQCEDGEEFRSIRQEEKVRHLEQERAALSQRVRQLSEEM
jgi:hypothetical protein